MLRMFINPGRFPDTRIRFNPRLFREATPEVPHAKFDLAKSIRTVGLPHRTG